LPVDGGMSATFRVAPMSQLNRLAREVAAA